MRNRLLLAFSVLSAYCFSQSGTDSAAIKNKLLIEQLRQRIATIEDPNGMINELKSKDKKNQDSIKVLNEMLGGGKEKQKNTDGSYSNESTHGLNNNAAGLALLGTCHCVRIYYKLNQTEADYAAFNELDYLIVLLKENPDLKLKLVGHADKTGIEDHNVALSKERAMRLKNYLVKNKNISEERIRIEWHGSTIPLIVTDNPNKKLINRRAEIFVE